MDSMNEITISSKQIAAIINTIEDIAIASENQTEAITLMTAGVDQISEVVQTNSDTAQELATSTEELVSQTQLIKSEIAKYTLNQSITD